MVAEAAAAVAVVADVVAAEGSMTAHWNSSGAQSEGRSRLGLAWRPELSQFIARSSDIGFSEVLAEDFWNAERLPLEFDSLREQGPIVPHAVSLSLGGARRPDASRLDKLARLAERLDAPFVSEHFAFVRAGKWESGHLLPLKRDRVSLEMVIENIAYAQSRLPVPLCLENIACLADWPDQQMSELEFITEIIRMTGAGILLDVANLYANCKNFGLNYLEYLERLPLDKVFYVHVAGGCMVDGLYHDTHAHPLQLGPVQILQELCKRITPPAVLLERDDELASLGEIRAELDIIAHIISRDEGRAVA